MNTRENEIKLHEIELIRSRLEYLNNIKRPLSGFIKEVKFRPEDAVVVLQNEFAITHAEDKMPVLASYGAGPCIIVAIYDSKNKVAIMAHCDETSDINNLQEIVSLLSLPNTQAHLYGYEVESDSANLRNCYEIVKFLETNKIKISNADILRSKGSPDASLAIDARTGVITSPINSSHLNITEAENSRIDKLEFECNKQFVILQTRLEDLDERAQSLSVDDFIKERDSLAHFNMNEVYFSLPEKVLNSSSELQTFSLLSHKPEINSETKNDEDLKKSPKPPGNMNPQ